LHFADDGQSSAADNIVVNNVNFDEISYTPQTLGDETYGGVFYFDCTSIATVTLTDVVGTNFKSETHGGFFYFKNFAGDLILDGANSLSQQQFTDFAASTAGSFLYSEATILDISISSTIFECDTGVDAATLLTLVQSDLFSDEPDPATRAGAFYIEDPTAGDFVTVTAQDNEYRKCAIAQEGAIYSVKTIADFSDMGSIYELNAAITGGAIKNDGSKTDFTDVTMDTNYAG